MTLIAVAAGKGSPGVSTTALVLAAVWPRPAVLAECDPSGGDLVFTLRREGGDVLAGDRGIVSLATALRVPGAATEVLAHAQMADGGLPVLVGVASVAHARALAASWRAVASALAASPVDVIADCGRLTGDPVTDDVLGSCGRLLLVCRATPAGVAHTRAALELLRGRHHELPVSVVVIGAAGAPAQVAAALRGFGEPDLLGPLAFDPAAAAAFSGRWTRRLDRSPLVVSARQVARAVDTRSTRPSQAAEPAPMDQPAPLSEVG